MAKKSSPFLYRDSLYENGQEFSTSAMVPLARSSSATAGTSQQETGRQGRELKSFELVNACDYGMAKKSCPFLLRDLIYEMIQDFLDILCYTVL